MHALNVWLVSPEFAPQIRYGGIGTGLRGFAQALRRRGHRVTVSVPAPGQEGLREIVEDSGIRILLVPVPGNANDGYGVDVSTRSDAVERTAVFVTAVVEQIAKTHHSERMDVIHVHEWPCAMVPYLLRQRNMDVGTVLTIHNLAYQGIFPVDALAHFGLGKEHAQIEALELYGRISLLKGGIVASDKITTVSPTYAREIQTPEHGELLDGVFRSRRHDLLGILNGIDTTVWNPPLDPALPAHFNARDLSGKRECKRLFCAEHGLPEDKPLVASLGRLVEQKGIDWLVAVCPSMIEMGANLAVAGAGDRAIEELVDAAARGLSGRMVVLGRVSDETARRLLAAADFLVMPSRWEPCGIVQLQALRYGAIPIGRRTGGLADTIIDADERPEVANGFLYDEPSSLGLIQAISRALHRYGSVEADALRKRGMAAMVGWEGPVRAYEEVYRNVRRRSFDYK